INKDRLQLILWRWQDRLTPVWKRVAGGCHLNRAIRHLLVRIRLSNRSNRNRLYERTEADDPHVRRLGASELRNKLRTADFHFDSPCDGILKPLFRAKL